MKASRLLAAAGMGVFTLGLACSEFAVVNPYDPRYDVQVSLTGPDTATSVGQILTFTVSTTPVWTGTPPTWTSSVPGQLASLGDGRFRVLDELYDPVTVTVGVSVGPHSAQHAVVLKQRVATLILQDGNGVALDTLRYNAYQQARALTPVAYDSSGTAISLSYDQWPAIVSRDPQVVQLGTPYAPQSVGDGRTWIVASIDGISDSVPAVVRQLPASFECSAVAPTDQIAMALNDSVQISVTRWVDSTGHTVDSLPGITGWQMVQRSVDYPPGTSLEVTATGMVYSHQYANTGTVHVFWTTPDSAATGEAGRCVVTSQ